jgi:hypothetical protein
MGTPSTAK